MPDGLISLLSPAVYKQAQAINCCSPARGSPGCIMWPAATFINCVFTTKITQYGVTPPTRINWTARHSVMQKIRIIGFFFENGLHWQFAVHKVFYERQF